MNYDLLIAAGFEEVGAPYFDGFDGFDGGVEARFLSELVEPHDAPATRQLPSGFVRLWKLHGSTTWRSIGAAEAWRMVLVGGAHAGASAIYPSDETYEEWRRVPFVVLIDRFRRALVEPETITLVTGSSFGDAHLNEALFDAAYRHPRSNARGVDTDRIRNVPFGRGVDCVTDFRRIRRPSGCRTGRVCRVAPTPCRLT